MPDSGSTRRNFLIASGAGAAAAGVAAALPATADARTADARTAKPAKLPSGARPLIAHVSDPASGRISVLVGEHEVTVHDPDLVARLAQHANTAAQTREA